MSGGNFFQGKFYGERAIILGGNCPVVIVRRAIFLEGNYPRGKLFWGQSSRGYLSGGKFSSGAIVQEPFFNSYRMTGVFPSVLIFLDHKYLKEKM